MNTIREINRINERELELGVKGSWHDEYKDSAYIFVGGLAFELTEGDVITIFSQWGEIADINLPRDKETGKTRGFGFVMYEDQRSTVLAVDNMNGAQVLGRTIRVDHTRNYKQPGKKNEDGEWEAPEAPVYNALPPTIEGSESSDSSDGEADSLDEEDPMAAFIRAEKKAAKKKLTNGEKGTKRKREGESKEDRKRRKEEKRVKKEEKRRKKKEESHGTSVKREIGRDGSEFRERRERSGSESKDKWDDRKGRANRDDWRDGKWELEREMKSRDTTDDARKHRDDGRPEGRDSDRRRDDRHRSRDDRDVRERSYRERDERDSERRRYDDERDRRPRVDERRYDRRRGDDDDRRRY
ncbi:hypothetical protein IAR55_003821 [Kwoniella newhampshirensis]|uniref:RRM domain-containing protein n=1 Tax=Kwoniella newhampshirensis TaxID=1651941 RepID=A0AAW0YVW0_9TREE